MQFLPDGTFSVEDKAALQVPEPSSGGNASATLPGPGFQGNVETFDTSPYLDDGGLRIRDTGALQVADRNGWSNEPGFGVGFGGFEPPTFGDTGLGSSWGWGHAGLIAEPWMQTVAQDAHDWEKAGKSWDWMEKCCEECGTAVSCDGQPQSEGPRVAVLHSTLSLSPEIALGLSLSPVIALGSPQQPQRPPSSPQDWMETPVKHKKVPITVLPPKIPEDAKPVIKRTDSGLSVVGWTWRANGWDWVATCAPIALPNESYNCIGYALGIYNYWDNAEWVDRTLSKHCQMIPNCNTPCPATRPIKIKAWFFTQRDAWKVYPDRDAGWVRTPPVKEVHMVRINADGTATSKSNTQPTESTRLPADHYAPRDLNEGWKPVGEETRWPGRKIPLPGSRGEKVELHGKEHKVRFDVTRADLAKTGCYCCDDVAANV